MRDGRSPLGKFMVYCGNCAGPLWTDAKGAGTWLVGEWRVCGRRCADAMTAKCAASMDGNEDQEWQSIEEHAIQIGQAAWGKHDGRN